MTKKIDYILYYEHVSRELESVKKVKKNLDSMGYTGVILPIHFNRYLNVIKYKPKIVIVPYLYSKNNLTHLRYKKLYGDVKCLNLHSEQISNENTVDFMMPKDKYSRNVYHIAWGDKFANSLIKSGVEREKVFITGSIRNDSIFDQKKDDFNINNILIPTSFSLTMVSEQYISNLEQSMNKRKLKRNIDFMKKSRNKFFKLIYQAAKKVNEKNFCLRPHPYVDIDLYISIFKEINNIEKIPNNIIVERKGNIQEFFSKGNKIIAWHSTSIIEGAMMDKKVAILAPIKFPSHMYMSFMDFIKILSSEEDLLKFIKTKNIKTISLDKYIYDNFYKVDGLSSLRVAKVISKLIPNNNKKNIIDKNYLFKLLKNTLIKDFPKNILFWLHLLDKVNYNYKGIIEDSVEILKTYNFYESNKEVNFKKTKYGTYVNII